MSAENIANGEFPQRFKFTRYQDRFLTHILEKLYGDYDFSRLENEDSSFFLSESHHLAAEFRNAQQARIGGHLKRGEEREKEELRKLDFIDVVRFAHNGVLEWEVRAKKCRTGSDNYIEAVTESYEWIKIARLAEHTVNRRLIGTLPEGNVIWPRKFSNTI